MRTIQIQTLLTVLMIFFAGIVTGRSVNLPVVEKEVEKKVYVDKTTLNDWNTLIMAIAKTESEFDFKAKGSSNDLGLLQITEVYVKDVNRILGKNVYSHKDAFKPKKAIEMFNIIQNNYNPKKDAKKAIKQHNPNGHAIGYPDKVKKNIEWVKKYEEVRKLLVQNP